MQTKSVFKILLINPPHIQRKGLYPKVVFEPIGLAYIGAVLEQDGYDVSILDTIGSGFELLTDIDGDRQLVGLSYEAITDYIRAIAPNIVGIGIPFTIREESALKIAGLVKAVDTRIKVILGGIHATCYPTQCLQNDSVDFLVLGEGEVPMRELANCLSEGTLDGTEKINSIAYRKNGELIINSRKQEIENIDELPFPARHLLPMEQYEKAAAEFKSGRQGKKFASVITSRGCPFRCNFCVSYNIMGRKWRSRTPENVVAEIELLLNKYGVKFIHFEDDNFTFDRDRLYRICELIIKNGLKIKWDTPNGIRADTIVDQEVLFMMKKSGCVNLCVAPESGNQYVVNNIFKKVLDLTKVEEVVKLCKKIGIKVEVFFVIGVVGETKKQIQDTLDFSKKLRKLGASRCHFHIATPFKGTALYEEAEKNGYLVDSPEGCIKIEAPRIATPDFSILDIDKFFIEGCKSNSIVPWDKIGLFLYLLKKDPVKLMKSTFNYLTKRVGSLSS